MRLRHPDLSLSAGRLVGWLGIAAFAALLIQLSLGASIVVLGLASLSVLLGLFGFLFLGAYNLGSWLLLFYVFGNVLVALYAKTLFLQPLDSHLYSPSAAFAVLALVAAELLVAVLIVRRIGLGAPILQPVTSPRQLTFLSWGCFLLGVVFWIINQHYQGPEGTGFGGYAVFRDLLLMAVVARTALLLERSGDKRSVDLSLVVIILVGVALGLLSDTKTYAAYPVLCYFATVVFYRRRISITLGLGLFGAIVVFALVVTPLIHAWRRLGIRELTTASRIDLMAREASDLLPSGDFERLRALASVNFRGGYYHYFGGNGRGQELLGRFASVQQIDPVIAQVDRQGPVGGSAIWPVFSRLLPRVLNPNKPSSLESYRTLGGLGLITASSGKYPTLPLAGQAYAAGGLLGVLGICFVTFCGFLLALKKIGWSLYRNVFAIFFFCDFVVVYAGQGDLSQYAGLVFRNAPLFILVFWGLKRISRIRLHPALSLRVSPP